MRRRKTEPSSLCSASQSGKETVEKLLKGGANVNGEGRRNHSSVLAVQQVEFGASKMVETLLKAGANVDQSVLEKATEVGKERVLAEQNNIIRSLEGASENRRNRPVFPQTLSLLDSKFI